MAGLAGGMFQRPGVVRAVDRGARELMPEQEAAEFGRESSISCVLARDGLLELTITASLAWGRPL